MTTKLEGADTCFLPFNQGSNGAGNVGGKGNSVNQDGYDTASRLQKRDILTLMCLWHFQVKLRTKEKLTQKKKSIRQKETDSNVVYDLKNTLDEYRVYQQIEINSFANVWYSAKNQEYADLGKLKAKIQPILNRFDASRSMNK